MGGGGKVCAGTASRGPHAEYGIRETRTRNRSLTLDLNRTAGKTRKRVHLTVKFDFSLVSPPLGSRKLLLVLSSYDFVIPQLAHMLTH